MESEKLLIDARARIIWGEPASSVRESLISKGLSADEADANIKKFCAERNGEIRKIGFRNILIGGSIVLGSAILVYLWWAHFHLGLAITHIAGKGAALFVMGGIYGLWKLVDGIFDFVRPQSDDKSIPDMSD